MADPGPDTTLGLSELNLTDESLNDLLEQLSRSNGLLHPPALVVVRGQNILVKNHGGSLFGILKRHAPRWYHVASDAFIAMYSWHGTTDSRPIQKQLASTMINQSIETFSTIDPTWNVENVSIQIGDMWYTTSFDNAGFMDCLKATVGEAQNVFYKRTTQVVRYLLLPSDTALWQHPGIIPSEKLTTGEQIDYVKSLTSWSPLTGYNLWHDFRRNEEGVTVLYWFERHSLKYLMDSVHFFVGSPGYLYIQEPYANADTGGDDWGPLSAATFNSTTWILATIHVYLWSNVLGNKRFSTENFTNNRRDVIIEKQIKIKIMFKRILRRSVPGLTPEQNEIAYFALHRFMNTNPNLPFQT